MQIHYSSDGTTLEAFVSVISSGNHIDPDGWSANPNSANVIVTSQPSAIHSGTKVSTGNYKFGFSGLTAIPDGQAVSVEINGSISGVAWTEWVEWVIVKRKTHDANVVRYNGTSGVFSSGRPEVNTVNLDTQLSQIKDYSAYSLAILAGNCSTAGTTSETYIISLNGVTYTAAYDTLTEAGNRGTTSLSKI